MGGGSGRNLAVMALLTPAWDLILALVVALYEFVCQHLSELKGGREKPGVWGESFKGMHLLT